MAKLWLKGYPPYIGSWDQNFPGIIIIHAIENLLLGDSIFAFRVWDVLFQLLTVFLIYRTTSVISDKRAGWIAGVLYALYYTHQNLNIAGEREVYITLCLLGILLLFEREKRNYYLIGLLLGFTIVIRPTSALYGLPILIAAFREKTKSNVLPLFLSSALPVVLLAIYLLSVGALGEFYIATVAFTTSVYNRVLFPYDYFEALKGYWAVFLFLPFGLYWLTRSKAKVSLIGSFTVLSALILLLLQRLPYHYHPLITFLIVFSSVGLVFVSDQCTKFLTKQNRRISYTVFALLTVTVVAISFRGATMHEWTRRTVHGEHLTLEGLRTEFNHVYPEEVKVGEYLKAHTTASDKVQGLAPLYPFYFAGRVPSSRFITAPALVMRSERGELSSFQKEWRAEYLKSLSVDPPKYYVIYDGDLYSKRWLNGNAGHEIVRNDLTELGDLLTAHYTRDTVIGGFTLYKLQ